MNESMILVITGVLAWTISCFFYGKRCGEKSFEKTIEDIEPRLATLEEIAASRSLDAERMDWLADRWVPSGDSISQAILSPYGNDLRLAIDVARGKAGV